MRRDDGFATLAVLVVSGLLAAIVSMLVLLSRPALVLTKLGADDLVMENLMESGIAAAGYLLFLADVDAASVDGRTIRLPSGSVILHVSAEAGRVDLNASPRELLEGVFKAAGGQSLSPRSFAARVVDWRDEDDERTTGGAERTDYLASDAIGLPANVAFQSVNELRFVRGLSEADYVRLQPFVTVYNRTGLLYPAATSRRVLMAIPEMSNADASALRSVEAPGAEGEDGELRELSQRYDSFVTLEAPKVYRLDVVVRSESGRTSAAHVIIADAEDEAKGYAVYDWAPAGRGAR